MTDNLIADLASLVRRLGYALKRTGENDKLVYQAVEFLKRHDLGGSIIREMDKVPTEKPWFSNNEQAIRWLRDEARQWHDDNPAVAAHLTEAAMMFEKDARKMTDYAEALRFARSHLYCTNVQITTSDDVIISRHIEDALRRIREVLTTHDAPSTQPNWRN